jgi:hypothetical protein
MLDPFRLNEFSVTGKMEDGNPHIKAYPITWFDPRGHIKNIGVENIKGAWEIGYDGIPLPVAVHPTYLHPRMSAQRSVFTIHGSRKEPLCDLIPDLILRRFIIDPYNISIMMNDLHILGIHESTAFPDLDGLSNELSALY